MEKTIFKDQKFHGIIIVVLGLLLCWNLYVFLISGSLVALIPTLVQTIALVLVLMKHKHAKIAIKIWAVILMLGGGLQIVGKALKLIIGDDLSGGVWKFIWNLILLLAGFAIYHFAQRTIEVKQLEEKPSE